MTTTKKIIIIVLALVVVWYLAAVFTTKDADAAPVGLPLTQAKAAWVVDHHGRLTTYKMASAELCPEYRHGVFAGWVQGVEKWSNTIPSIHQFTFGPWSGSYCSNHVRIWSVNWGGEPGGWANIGFLWHYDLGATHIYTKDGKGVVRYRGWKTRMYSTVSPIIHPECFPWLYVSIGTDAEIGTARGVGC